MLEMKGFGEDFGVDCCGGEGVFCDGEGGDLWVMLVGCEGAPWAWCGVVGEELPSLVCEGDVDNELSPDETDTRSTQISFNQRAPTRSHSVSFDLRSRLGLTPALMSSSEYLTSVYQ